MLDPARLVFIDETAVTTKMVRLYGRSPRGVELIGRAPCGKWETITFVAALRHNKMVAPMVVEGAMNAEMFLAYVEQCLVPTLTARRYRHHGQVIVHKGAAIRKAIEMRARRFATCLSTRPTSIPSRCPSANSRHSCAKPPNEQCPGCAGPFARSCRASALKNVPTTSGMRGTCSMSGKPF